MPLGEAYVFFEPHQFKVLQMTFPALLAYTPSLPELIIFLVVVLIFFGPKRLPGLSRALGKSINEFKRGKAEVQKEIDEGAQEANVSSDVNESETSSS